MAGPALAAGASGPLFRQVLDVLRREILQGMFPVGRRLPTEAALALRFGLSRHTIREALRELRQAGLVTSLRGSGTTVARQPGGQYYLHENGSLDDLLQYVTSSRWQYTIHAETLDATLANQLESTLGQHWLRLEGCRYAAEDAKPLYWTQAYIHGDMAGVAQVPDRRDTPFYELMEDMYGVQIGEVEQIIRGRKVPARVATLLGLRKGDTVIEMVRNYRLTNGKLVEVSTNLHPIDGFSLAMKLRRRTD